MESLPAHLANRRPSGLTNAVSSGLSTGAPPTLSIARGRFTLVDAAGNERALTTMDAQLGPYADAVIVQANPHVSKVYYDVAYDPAAQEFSPPACFSDNGLAPSTQAAKPQSQTCATCRHNAWGSKVSQITGKATKACQDAKKIAVVLPGQADMPFLLRVPPNSLKHLAAYARTIAAQNAGSRQVEMSDVVTRITFDPQVQGTLNFTAVGWVDEPTIVAIEKIWDAKAADNLVGITDQPFTGQALAAPSAISAQPAGQQLRISLPDGQAGMSGSFNNQLPPPPPPVPAAQSSNSVPPQPASAPTTESPAPPRRRGRPPKAETAQAPAPQQATPPFMQAQVAEPGYAAAQVAPARTAQAEAPAIPAFLQRQPAQAPVQHGMVQAPAGPSPELSAALDKAMNLPLPGGK